MADPQTTDYGDINTNEPPTVREVIAFLKKFRPDQTVRAYEGEGGSWIIVETKND